MISKIKLPSFIRKKKESSAEHDNKKLAKHLKSFRRELESYLEASPSTMNLSSQFAIQLDKLPSERNEAYAAVLDTLPKGLDANNLAFLGNNNFNMKVNTKNAAIMVQGMAMYQSQIDAITKLTRSGSAEFLPVNYAPPQYVQSRIKITQQNYDKNRTLNSDIPREAHRENFVISCIEQFPTTFNDKASQIAPENVYSETAGIASQMSAMLTTLNDAGIVWTDIKPGNLLARHDGSLAVADLKGFADIDTIFISKGENIGEVSCKWNANCSIAFMSEEGRTRLLTFKSDNPYSEDPGAEARAHFAKEWQKEYSYQMGVVLYVSITGRVKEEDLIPRGRVEFDYDLPAFKTQQGKEYKAILESLTADDPDQRLSCSEAASMMEKIANQNKSMPEKFCHQPFKTRLAEMKAPSPENLEEEPSLKIK